MFWPTNNSLTWTLVATGISGINAVSAGWNFSLALTSTGLLYGAGYGGAIGTGNTANKLTFTQVAGGITGINAISAGNAHSLALTSGGLLYVTGSNPFGALGTGGTATSLTWVQAAAGIPGISAVSAGAGYSVLLTGLGNLYVTGANTYGALGTGDTSDRHAWTQIYQCR